MVDRACACVRPAWWQSARIGIGRQVKMGKYRSRQMSTRQYPLKANDTSLFSKPRQKCGACAFIATVPPPQ